MIGFDDTPSKRANRDNVRELGRFELRGDKMAPVQPKLADPTPPVEPPHVLPNAQPKAHDVVIWRNDGEVRKLRFQTKELAFETYNAVSYVIAYKAVVMDGREIIARRLIEAEA